MKEVKDDINLIATNRFICRENRHLKNLENLKPNSGSIRSLIFDFPIQKMEERKVVCQRVKYSGIPLTDRSGVA